MILGTLKKVMGLHEDGVTARRRKAINTARKDPNTNVGIIYDGGTQADYYNKFKEIATNKERKQIDKKLSQMTQKDLDKEQTDAAYDFENDVYGVRKDAAIPYLLNARGDINYRHPVMKHEVQHRMQQKALESIAKQYDRKANQKRPQLINTISDYKANISKDNKTRNYYRSPAEFEANIAGVTRNPHPGMSTVRIARNTIGKSTPKREFIPSYTHGKEMNERVYGTPSSLSKRRQDNIDDKSQTAQDRSPRSGQPNMNKEKYNQRAQETINSITVPTKRFNPDNLDFIKGMSRNPEVNKSKNFPKSN